MTEKEKSSSLLQVLLRIARRAKGDLPERPSKPPLQPDQKTVFMAESNSPVKPEQTTTVLTRARTSVPKTAVEPRLEREAVLQKAAEANPQFAAAIGGKPIRDEKLQDILAEAITRGKTLVEIAERVREAILAKRIKTNEGPMFLARVAGITNNFDLAVQPSGASGWIFFDEGNPGSASSSDVIDALKRIQHQLNADPYHENDPRFLDQVANDLGKAGFPIDEIRPYIARLRNQQEAFTPRPRGERFSSLYLSPEEEKEMILNPKWVIEKKLRQIEESSVLFPDSPGAEEATRRMGLMNSYFLNAQYKEDVRLYAVEKLDLEGSQLDNFVQERIGAFREVSDKVNSRTGIHKVYGMIRGLGDSEKISSTLLTVGEAGFEHLLNENGGLNEIAFNKYVNHYKLARFDDNGKLRRLDSQILHEIRDLVTAEMREDMALYGDLYRPAYGNELTSDDCDAIVRQAEFALVMSQQDLVAILGGLGPGESSNISGFASAITGEKLLGAMDINRWFFEKWTNLKPGQQVIWNNICRVGAESSGKMPLIDERLRGIQRGTLVFDALVEEAFGSVDAMKKLVRFDRNGHEARSVPNSFSEVTLDQLRDRLLVVEGEKEVGKLLEVYDHFSSGWRIDTHLKQIERTYGGYGKQLALGMRLRYAGAHLISAEKDNAKEKALHNPDHPEEGVIAILGTIAKHRPQALMEFLIDGKDNETVDWFTNYKNQGKLNSSLLGEEISRPDHLYGFVSRRFLNINELLATEGLPPIDYSGATISIEQRRVVEQVCGSLGTNSDNYFSLMRDMSRFVGQGENIHKLTEEKYYHIYARTRWIDDARLRFLEKPDKAPIASGQTGAEEGYTLPLSKLFTYEGRSDVDPLVRTWRDGNVAFKAIQEVYGALTPNEKTYLEKIVAINTAIGIYSGHEPASTRATLYILGGWGETAKTDIIYDWLFMGGLGNSSAMKRRFGDKAPSMGLNELEELIDKHDFELLGKMKDLAPETFEHVERFLGISWTSHGTEYLRRLPLYLYRSRMLIGLALVLIILESGKTVGQTLGERSDKG